MNTNKTVIAVAVVIGLFIGLVVGHSFWPQRTKVGNAAIPTTASSGSQRQEEFVINPSAGVYASSTNNYVVANPVNNNGRDRLITEIDYYYTGLASTISTSSPSAINLRAATSTDGLSYYTNTNFVLDTNTSTSTTLDTAYVASTSPGITSLGTAAATTTRIWANGQTLNFQTSATTSSLVISVKYLQL